MKILFLCTAYNSLSQRLFLELSSLGHDVSIEYALSDETMQDAVDLFQPDLIICPFLTARVPKEIYNKVLTLIIHPGPPGDAGPSALDWLLMGDDGSIEDSTEAITALNTNYIRPGRSHWGVTVIQAIEDFDAGPIWAFEQFPIDIDQPGLTKSELYRGPVTRAAVIAAKAAIVRVKSIRRMSIVVKPSAHYTTGLRVDPNYAKLSVTDQLPFQGGLTHHRPLLKAAQRDFDVTRHTALQISRRIRCADSQPGVLSSVFGVSLYVYGGVVEEGPNTPRQMALPGTSTVILGVRNEAVCIAASDGKGIWVTHVRQPKRRNESLQPKVPATSYLLELGILNALQIKRLQWPTASDWSLSTLRTLQDIWVDIRVDENKKRTAFLYWEFYNGAMATDQCSRLIEAMEYIISKSSTTSPIHAVALMGGSYFSNGIALNVAEAASDPAEESWLNINLINDVVHYILHEFPSRGILTIAAMRGNAAAGGVALAAACDIVIAGSSLVLNPAYRAIGLSGSEYHTLTYYARCGTANADKMLRTMQPMSPIQAQRIGLVDYVFPSTGEELEDYMRTHITLLLKPGCLTQGFWKAKADLSPASLARARARELGEMSKDFWSPRSVRYHKRRFDFVRKVKPSQTPLRFAMHRRNSGGIQQDEEETDQFDDVGYFKESAEREMLAELCSRMLPEITTPHPLNANIVNPMEIAGMMQKKGDATRNVESLYACYYKPIDEFLTPPATPPELRLNGAFAMEVENSSGRLIDAFTTNGCRKSLQNPHDCLMDKCRLLDLSVQYG